MLKLLEKRKNRILKNFVNENKINQSNHFEYVPFSHGGKKVIFHGKEWKSLEFNLIRLETDKGIVGGLCFSSWKAVRAK